MRPAPVKLYLVRFLDVTGANKPIKRDVDKVNFIWATNVQNSTRKFSLKCTNLTPDAARREGLQKICSTSIHPAVFYMHLR